MMPLQITVGHVLFAENLGTDTVIYISREIRQIPTLILTDNSSIADNAFLSVSERNRILSSASEALEINSLKKI